MRDIIYEQEEQIGLGPRQSRLISTVKKSRGLKGGSMVNIIGELEDTASSPSQTPLVPYANDDRPVLASPQTNDDDKPATKRKRGPTKCLKTHGLSYEDRLPIRLNKYGQPIGCNRAKLSSHLGTLVRNAHLAPLTYTNWHGLKVLKEQSKKNKASRAKNTSQHTTGSKTFAEIREEEAMKNPDRREPSQVNMFFLTHKSRDGKPMSEGTSKNFSELEDAIVSHPEKLESTNQDDILSQVLGKDQPGRVRTYGRGVVASDLWGSRSQVETERLIKEVKENAQTEIQNIQQKMQEEMEIKLQERVEDMKSQMLCGFNVFLNQLQKNLPGVEIPNLSFLSTTLNTKEVEAIATANHEVFTAEKEVPSKSSTIIEDVFNFHTKSLSQTREKNVILSPKKKQAFCSSLTQEVLDLKLKKMKHDQHKKRSKKKKVVCL
ncbi:hypothetical protein Ahy_Scaffold1g106767 isoform A [Arachis hypogaea]|uniref:Uncharacterized protein n=1 Tax=Arachis hypogaea TaxID=3818 RepID=A0A444WS37_ARAHY|nr:hypothetical protein Ahy_Scaffold1g106767 isoform A [Arachis hypogaea]